MDPSARPPKFPIFKIGIVGATIAIAMYFTLQVFNPHLDPDPSDGQPREKTQRQKQAEFLMKLLNKKPKK